MKSEVSELYRKYIIQIHLREVFYYLIWGTDLEDPDQSDYLLVNYEDKILLFSRIDQISSYVAQPTVPLFDEPNLRPWSESITISDAYVTYDLDYFGSLLTSQLKQEQILNSPDITYELVNFLNLFGDYAYQLDDEQLISIRRTPQIRLFFDYCGDTYLWKMPDEELQLRHKAFHQEFQFTQFKSDMIRLLETFISSCTVID